MIDNFSDTLNLSSSEIEVCKTKKIVWSLYEIIHICTAVVDESEEWSSQ